MAKAWLGTLFNRTYLRVALAVALIIVGLAPVGAVTLSDSGVQQVLGRSESFPIMYMYRVGPDAGKAGAIVRSRDLGDTWELAASLPEQIEQVEAAPADRAVAYARGQSAIWVTADGGETWEQTAPLPSRPLALAVSPGDAASVIVGTESLGLVQSNDRGLTWRAVAGALPGQDAVALGITALAVHPEDSRLIYAAAGYWLGTGQRRFTPAGVYMSVDGGQQWFLMEPAGPGSERVERLTPVAGHPTTVLRESASGTFIVSLMPDAGHVRMLDDVNPAARAAAARLLGLSGDPEFLGPLMAHLGDENAAVGSALAEAIARLDDGSRVEALMQILESGNEMAGAQAGLALGRMKVEAAAPALGRLLRSESPAVRQSAGEALAAIGTPAAIAELMGPLADVELTPARHTAMQALEEIGWQAAGPVAELLASPDPVVRRNAAEVLGWLRSPGSVAELSRALSDSSVEVRKQAAWALSEIGTSPAEKALSRAARREADPEARQHMQLALARAQEKAQKGPQPAYSLLSALLTALSRVPATRWTFLGLALILAAVLIWIHPGRINPSRR